MTLWEQILWRSSNDTGQVSHDVLMENALKKLLNDGFKPKIANGDVILGTKLDPVWLFPIGPLELKKGKIFKGQLTACNLHLHNGKAAEFSHVEVQRNEALNTKAIKVVANFPILWMTGKYLMRKVSVFGFLPVPPSQGFFNIDLKSVTVTLLASLKIRNESVVLDEFEVGLSWQDSSVKYDSPWSDLDKIGDLILNKVSFISTIHLL